MEVYRVIGQFRLTLNWRLAPAAARKLFFETGQDPETGQFDVRVADMPPYIRALVFELDQLPIDPGEYGSRWTAPIPYECETVPPTDAACLDSIRAQLPDAIRAAQARVDDILAREPSEFIHQGWNSGGCLRVDSDDIPRQCGYRRIELDTLWARVEGALADALAGEERLEKERKEKETEKRAAAGAENEAHADAISAWVAEHGDLSQAQRHQAGVLPLAEVRDAIRSEFFGHIDESRYARLTDSDVCSYHSAECEYGCYTPDYSVSTAEEVDDATWRLAARLRESVADWAPYLERPVAWTIEIREHTAACSDEDCDATASRLSVLLTAVWAGHRFSREYQANEV